MVMWPPRISRSRSSRAGQKILALEHDLALHGGGAAQQTHDRKRGDRFAGARLADERQRGAAFQREGNAIDGDGLGIRPAGSGR